jgi:hypothetical protein
VVNGIWNQRSRWKSFTSDYIRRLTPQQKQQLMEKIAQDLATPKLGQADSNPSLLDLAGLGAEVWQGMDAQQYVDQLRAEWDK